MVKYELVDDVNERLINMMCNAAQSDLAQPFVLVLMALKECPPDVRDEVLQTLLAVCDEEGISDEPV